MVAGTPVNVVVTATPAPAAVPDTLVILASTTPPGFDPDIWGGKSWEKVLLNVYDMATEYQMVKPEDIGLKPGVGVDKVAKVNGKGDEGLTGALFESWEVSPDGQTITLHVRKGEKSFWGHQMTADSWIWRIQRAYGLNQVGAFAFTVAGITGPQDVVKVDDMTVKMHTPNGPSPIFFKVMSIPFMNAFDLEQLKADGCITTADPWATKCLQTSDYGFGAYHVVEYTPGTQVKFDANPYYWKGKPFFKHVIVREVDESANILAMMVDGEGHFTNDLTIAEKYAFVGGKGEATYVGLPESNWHLALYVDRLWGAFKNADCYRAFGYAIPYEQIRDAAYKGFGVIAHEIVPPMYGASVDVGDSPYKYDIDKAKALWKSGNCPNSFTMTMDTEHPEWEDVATLIRAEFEKLGVNVLFQKQPANVISAKQGQGVYEVTFEESTAFTADAGYALWLNWDINSFYNFQQWKDAASKECTALIDKSLTIPDGPARNDILHQAQKIAVDQGGMMYILWTGYHNAANKHLQGVYWWPTGEIHWYDLSWK
jgi:peptide/nickel transport system substrate-binding protein